MRAPPPRAPCLLTQHVWLQPSPLCQLPPLSRPANWPGVLPPRPDQSQRDPPLTGSVIGDGARLGQGGSSLWGRPPGPEQGEGLWAAGRRLRPCQNPRVAGPTHSSLSERGAARPCPASPQGRFAVAGVTEFKLFRTTRGPRRCGTSSGICLWGEGAPRGSTVSLRHKPMGETARRSLMGPF